MYYWNQKNFEGLKKVAEAYKEDDYLKLFAEYCHYRDLGVRKLAFQKINEFIKYCESCSAPQQQDISLYLLELIYKNQEIHYLLSDPLKKYLIKIMKLRINIDGDSLAYQWLGYLCDDKEMYTKGLELDPFNQFCRKALIIFDLNWLDWQTHHLNESLFIGTLEDAFETLEHIHKTLIALTNEKDKTLLEQRYRYYKALISAWAHYKNLNVALSFNDWCKAEGFVFEFDQAFYYTKG